METLGGSSRVCAHCSAEMQLPERLRSASVAAVPPSLLGRDGGEGAEEDDAELSDALRRSRRETRGSGRESPMSDVSSIASELNECPVCNKTLASLGDDSSVQEAHVRACLENGGGGSVQGSRYLGEC